MTDKLSPTQRKVLEYAAAGHTLILATGLVPRANWQGAARGAPRVRTDTVRKLWHDLSYLGLAYARWAQPFWGSYLTITEAGRRALKEEQDD